jgi:hypothetical protein
LSSPENANITPFPKPVEINLADVLFFAMRKNLMLFKDLGKKQIHYSIFVYGSTIDVHETFEEQGSHVQLGKVEFDWQLFMQRLNLEMRANWESIFRTAKITDSTWADLEIEFIPVKVLTELFPPIRKGIRWNIDLKFLEKLEKELRHAKLGEMSGHVFTIGTGSGYLVLTYGSDCFLFDFMTMSKIIERSFELSIRKINLKYYTLSSILWCARIRLLKLVYSTIKKLRELTC